MDKGGLICLGLLDGWARETAPFILRFSEFGIIISALC